MSRFYLYFNAALYLVLGLWCTLAPSQTAHLLGYEALSAGGASEYLVIYGGMELGFAAFFFFCAQRGQQLGIVFSLCIYTPVVLWRWPSMAAHWPVSATTLATAVFEVILLLAAIILWRRRPRNIFR